MNIGFSTGSLALGDFHFAMKMLSGKNVNAIELSALRESELNALMSELDYLDLSPYKFISIHAPSKLIRFSEIELIEILKPAINKGCYIVVHPDIISDFDVWKTMGELLCLENMDKRKPIGRTSDAMELLFKNLPEATFCFAIAHAKQVDPTMQEGYKMLKKFKNRLRQIHLSELNSNCKHEKLNLGAILSFQTISHLIPNDLPIILESPVTEIQINTEVIHAELVFSLKVMKDYLDSITEKVVDTESIISIQKRNMIAI